jgi:hypothetical protein
VTARERLPNRRASETFELECSSLRYTCTVSRYRDGRIAELFLSNHKSASAADVGARDAAIAFSFAVQHGADPETIRRALCRDVQGRAPAVRLAERSICSQKGRRSYERGHPCRARTRRHPC